MTTVLVAQGYDAQLISPHRCTLFTRLRVRLRGFALDHALADGADPDSSAAYSLRAAALISPQNRRSLARQVRATIQAAEHPPPRQCCAVVPVRRREVLRDRDLLEELAEVLDRSDPVEPRGVACTAILLHDGRSPLYYDRSYLCLRDALEAAIELMTIF